VKLSWLLLSFSAELADRLQLFLLDTCNGAEGQHRLEPFASAPPPEGGMDAFRMSRCLFMRVD
jgi:hypothetical protein